MYNLYSYDNREKFNFHVNKDIETDICQKISLSFDSPFKTNIKINDFVYSEIFISNNKNPGFKKNLSNTLLILLHGFASKKNRLDNYYSFIENMLQDGQSCAFMHMPYHLSRTPEGQKSGQKLIFADDAATLEFYHQAVVDARRLIDIAINNFRFEKVILCGFSLGSIVSVIASALDSRIFKTILVFGGGNWYQIHWNSSLAYMLKGNCIHGDIISRKKCRLFYLDFPGFCEEFKKTDLNSLINSDLGSHLKLKEKTTKLCFLCDPAAFASRINPEKILMLNCRFDHFFPRKSTIALWKGLGSPKIYWFNRFHSSKILANRKALKIIRDFIIDKQP